MVESIKIKPQLENLGNQLDKPKINESEVWGQCEGVVRDFCSNGMDTKYRDAGLQGRYEIADQFYSKVQKTMGIDAKLGFEPMEDEGLGGYNTENNTISLNSSYLENPESKDMLDTILHESRHAFQLKAIENPDSVSMDNSKIAEWKENVDSYINPEWDYEAYINQPIERDADDFAKRVIAAGFESKDYLTNLA